MKKVLSQTHNLAFTYSVKTEAGTYADNLGLGLGMTTGNFGNDFYRADHTRNQNKIFLIYAKTNVRFVAYNALLQGGMINHDNVFVLKSSEISRFVGSADAGIEFVYKGTGIELGQHFLTPEYTGGLWHKWGSISLLFKL